MGGQSVARPQTAAAWDDLMDYDEDRELTNYVWNHYSGLMTEFERRVGWAIIARKKASAPVYPAMAALLRSRWGGVDDPELNDALSQDPEEFRRQVRDRVLARFRAEDFINRCPSCERVVRTPKAQQCLWCGYDWHRRAAETDVGGFDSA